MYMYTTHSIMNFRIYIVLPSPNVVFHIKSQDIFDLRDDERRREVQQRSVPNTRIIGACLMVIYADV